MTSGLSIIYTIILLVYSNYTKVPQLIWLCHIDNLKSYTKHFQYDHYYICSKFYQRQFEQWIDQVKKHNHCVLSPMAAFLSCSDTSPFTVIELHIMSASCFEVIFIALHFSYCHWLLSLCSQQAWGHKLDIIPLGGSCWPSLLMVSAIHDKRHETGTWWLKCVCTLV